MTGIEIAQWVPGLDEEIDQLAGVLHAAVHAGASVSFVLPFSLDDARSFWRDRVAPAVESGARCVLIARWDGTIAGTVQLILDTPPNQRHRAEVAKLLVHPDARRGGIARALMQRLEALARESRRTLITLDTRTGDKAESLYASLGYRLAGVIPGYSRAPDGERMDATSYMYKAL